MSALKAIFPEWREGEEFAMEDVERWTMLNIVHGDFVEVNLQYTDWEGAPNIETGYLVMERFVSADGGMTLRERKCLTH